MKTEIKIGSIVSKITNEPINYMKNGIVTNISNDRAFVTWPSHGTSSVPLNSISVISQTNKLYKVVGKKNGQSVEITELPMSEDNCWKWIKEQGIENHYNNVCPIPYHGSLKEFIYS